MQYFFLRCELTQLAAASVALLLLLLLLCAVLPAVATTDANQLNGTNLTEDEVMAQLQQMQQLSETLVQDMRQ